MLNFFIGLMLGTPFGFVLGAMLTHAKYADERMAWTGDAAIKVAKCGREFLEAESKKRQSTSS